MTKKISSKLIALLYCFLLLASCGHTAAAVQYAPGIEASGALQEARTKEVRYDENESVVPRVFDQAIQKKLLKNKDLDYLRAQPNDLNWQQRFFMWLQQLLYKNIIAGVKFNAALRVLLYIFAGATVIYIVMSLLGISPTGLLFRNRKVAAAYGEVYEEDIHAIDFEAQLEEAIRLAEYRKATRLLYLAALKQLSDKQHIRWQPGKTNHEYVAEINVQELKEHLGELAYYFEYAWYGDFPLTESAFAQVRHTFISLKEKLHGL